MICVLILDDDLLILNDLSARISASGFSVSPCSSVSQATSFLQQDKKTHPIFSIVDLFLLGNEGMNLSNDFIAKELVPRKIPYGRFTSAPTLVPDAFSGSWIVDKRLFYRREAALMDPLMVSLSQLL